MFPLAFVSGSLQGHWWGFISRNYVVWPIFFLMSVFIALKATHFWFLFAFTTDDVVPCGGRKTFPRTSIIVQFIFYFWSFEISVNILRNQKYLIGLDSYSRQVSNYLDPILIYISLWIDCLFEICKIAVCFSSGFRCQVITGSLMRLYWPKLRSMTHLLSYECCHCS